MQSSNLEISHKVRAKRSGWGSLKCGHIYYLKLASAFPTQLHLVYDFQIDILQHTASPCYVTAQDTDSVTPISGTGIPDHWKPGPPKLLCPMLIFYLCTHPMPLHPGFSLTPKCTWAFLPPSLPSVMLSLPEAYFFPFVYVSETFCPSSLTVTLSLSCYQVHSLFVLPQTPQHLILVATYLNFFHILPDARMPHMPPLQKCVACVNWHVTFGQFWEFHLIPIWVTEAHGSLAVEPRKN